ncbi:MAG: hypothetical protein M3305_13335 [Actinomycetota bacterium]|nr:hypothetical protein [Actinomycetota bacterium]
MLAKTEELLDILAMAAMRAEVLAVHSPEYEALADAIGYALDLADLAYTAETHIFAALEPQDDY